MRASIGFICPHCETEMEPSFLFPKIGQGPCSNCHKKVTPPVPERLASVIDEIIEGPLVTVLLYVNHYYDMRIYKGKGYILVVPGVFLPEARVLIDLGILAPFDKSPSTKDMLQITQLGLYVLQHFREFVWRKT